MPRRRKRCPFCRCLFRPDPRSAWRQWSCTKPACQAERRQETQRRYREKHPSESRSRTYRGAVASLAAGEAAAGFPPQRGPLASLPWEEARDEISAEVLVMIVLFGRLLLGGARDEIREQVPVIVDEFMRLPSVPSRDETDHAGPSP